MRAPVRYANSGSLRIAYRTYGAGDRDVLTVLPTVGTCELIDEPPALRLVERLRRVGRLIVWDRRGMGLSDNVPEPPTLEEQVDDAVAVLDAAGAKQVILCAEAEATALAAMFAATHPERVERMVVLNGMARMTKAEGYEWAWDAAERRSSLVEPMLARWGTGENGRWLGPVLADGDPDFIEWWGRWERTSSPPSWARAQLELMGEMDVRAILPRIQAPTMICTRPDAHGIDRRHAAHLIEGIPGAEARELPGRDAISFGDGLEAYVDAIDEFTSGGVTRPAEVDRTLATVMFTDIVDSTASAAELGDRRWRELLERHDDLSRRLIASHGGVAVKSTGDGFLARFDGPARGARAALAIVGAAREIGLGMRAGVHTGEVERMGSDLGGVAVHIGSRITDQAGADEVLASSTVRDLVIGSGLEFAAAGEADLRGVPGRWPLFKVSEGPERR
ncbi:hypothetical protein HJD18_07885 [Thermoleophilia bacterium SCSIO 60948]|nr:hypothetical protein HJD18_07885 [Thermoleophilia bacterium SCSIO 60948]